MLVCVALIASIFLSFYLSSNPGVTSAIKERRDERAAASWSDGSLKICFFSIGLSIGILAVYGQFSLTNVYDLIAIICVGLSLALLIKNLVTKEKWSSTKFVKGKVWINSLASEYPMIYLFGYTIVKLFFLGQSFDSN